MPPFTDSRRKTAGYILVLASLMALLGALTWMSVTMQGSWMQRGIGAAITVLPLLVFVVGAVRRDLRSYQALALLAPVYLFIGGVVWLWADWRFGLWICVWSVLMQVGTIVHNYQKRKKKKVST